MNREPISYYLRNPSKLVDISVSQIEKWLQESPFSQPLRALLAKKLHFNQEIIIDSAISGAASAVGNRTWLYRELRGNEKNQFEHSTEERNAKEHILVEDDSIGIATTIGAGVSTTDEDSTMDLRTDTNAEVDLENTSNEKIQDPDNQLNKKDESKSIEDVSLTMNETVIDHEVEYEEVDIIASIEEQTSSEEKMEIDAKQDSAEDQETGESVDSEDEKDIYTADYNDSDNTQESEKANEEDLLESTIATLEREANEPRLVNLNEHDIDIEEVVDEEEDIELTHEMIDNIKVEIVGPEEEFAPAFKIKEYQEAQAKKKSKKEKKKLKKEEKKKKTKEETKKDEDKSKKGKKKKKSKKKKTDKKSDKKVKKDKKKSTDTKEPKKDQPKKDKKKKKDKAAKKKAKQKKIAKYWDRKIGTITPPPDVIEKRKEAKRKAKKKGKKIKLSKYEVSINPTQEEANRYYGEPGEMSEYTRWLMNFSKDNAESSFQHMSTYTSKSRSNEVDSKSATEVKAKKKSKKKSNKKSKGKNKTDKSLESNEEIISELWADLLAKQGHIKKARKMYLKLSLKYPEKSSYFAAKLENLKK